MAIPEVCYPNSVASHRIASHHMPHDFSSAVRDLIAHAAKKKGRISHKLTTILLAKDHCAPFKLPVLYISHVSLTRGLSCQDSTQGGPHIVLVSLRLPWRKDDWR